MPDGARRSPIPDVACAAVFALSLTATLIIIHRAVALPRSGRLPDHFPATGLVVFQRSTPWEVVLTWPRLVGIAVGAGWTGDSADASLRRLSTHVRRSGRTRLP